MKKISIFFASVSCAFNGKYPPAATFKFWAWNWDKNGNVKYNHFKTYLNYARSN